MAHHGTEALADVFARLERFCDAVPRLDARAEEIGGLVLFVRDGAGWPLHARPRPLAETPSAADVTAVRQRQRELGVPETFEWIHENAPDLLAVARSGGLDVRTVPLMTLEPAALLPALPVEDAVIRVLDPADPGFAADLAAAQAVARLGFGAPPHPPTAHAGLVIEPAGPKRRDAAPPPAPELVEAAGRGYPDGRLVTVVADSAADGIVATGVVRRLRTVAEIAGVATLPSHRRRGYATQVTARLARHAQREGATLIFLSATDDDTGRLYSRVGFRRIGTTCQAAPEAVPL